MKEHSNSNKSATIGFFAITYLIVLALNLDSLSQVPVWDTATGLFPAAIELARTGFDLPWLLEQPGWARGGPNTYATSPLTWMTAGLLSLLGDGSHLFVVLRLIHIGIAAALLTVFFRFVRPILGTATALLACVAILFWPVFRVQTGYMYFEIPLAAATVFCLAALSAGRDYWAAFWASLAIALKSAGVIVVATVFIAVLVQRVPWRRRLRHLLAVSVVPLVIGIPILIRIIAQRSDETNVVESGSQNYLALLDTNVIWRLSQIPDVFAVLVASLVVALFSIPFIWAQLRRGPVEASDSPDCYTSYSVALSLTLILAFAGFYLLAPATGVRFWMLPRYCTQIIPFLVLIVAITTQLIWTRIQPRFSLNNITPQLKHYLTAGFLALMSAFFLLNSSGSFYPPYKGNAFSIVERDLSYKDLLIVQQAITSATMELSRDTPKFYPRDVHYFTTYPQLGYVEHSVENGHFILVEEPYSSGRLEDFPGHFFLVQSNLAHGGEILRSIWRQAVESPNHAVKVFPIEHNGFQAAIVEVRATNHKSSR